MFNDLGTSCDGILFHIRLDVCSRISVIERKVGVERTVYRCNILIACFILCKLSVAKQYSDIEWQLQKSVVRKYSLRTN